VSSSKNSSTLLHCRNACLPNVVCLALCLALSSCSVKPAAPEEERIVQVNRWNASAQKIPRCGARIREEEVLVVDLEELDYDADSLQREVGSFTQVTDKPLAISAEGSRVEVEQRVQKTAAGSGCDLVLLGPVKTNTVYLGGYPTVSHGSGAHKGESPYQFFRMGYRAD
jgi:hypothetical protein